MSMRQKRFHFRTHLQPVRMQLGNFEQITNPIHDLQGSCDIFSRSKTIKNRNVFSRQYWCQALPSKTWQKLILHFGEMQQCSLMGLSLPKDSDKIGKAYKHPPASEVGSVQQNLPKRCRMVRHHDEHPQYKLRQSDKVLFGLATEFVRRRRHVHTRDTPDEWQQTFRSFLLSIRFQNRHRRMVLFSQHFHTFHEQYRYFCKVEESRGQRTA